MRQNATQLSALSRLFSSGVIREMAKKGRSPLFARLIRETALTTRHVVATATVGTTFDTAFAMLRKSGDRSEYVYRAALTHNILFGRHSLNTASLLTEFRAGTCKADLAILNGTSTVYEIKSDRDSLTRLSDQICNYRKVFAKIFVIAGDAHIQAILDSTPSDVGVLSLARWNRIRTVRDAAERADLVCPLSIFESLRSDEARTVLQNLGVSAPDVPNTLLRTAMRDCFALLSPADVHRQMVRVLKQTRNLSALNGLVAKLPVSLQPAALSLPISRTEHERLIGAVQTTLQDAMNWA